MTAAPQPTTEPIPVAVLGLGNLIRSDDGVGIHAVHALAGHPSLPANVSLVDGGTLGLELAACAASASLVLLLDAVDLGQAPGTLVRLTAQDLIGLPGGSGAHSLGLADLLTTLVLSAECPQEVLLLGVQPAFTGWGESLSGPVRAALPSLVRYVLAEIQIWTSRTRSPAPVNAAHVAEPGAARQPNAGAAPLALWAKSARKAVKFTQWRLTPGKQRGAASSGLGLQGQSRRWRDCAQTSVKRVAWRSHAGPRASQSEPICV